jgi:hypothetical protein
MQQFYNQVDIEETVRQRALDDGQQWNEDSCSSSRGSHDDGEVKKQAPKIKQKITPPK